MKKLIRITTIPGTIDTILKEQLTFMNNHYNVLAVSSSGNGKLKEVSKSEGVETYAVEMTRSITPFKDFLATYRLYKLFKKEQPFIVHTHTPKAGVTGMLAAKLARVPHRLHTVAGLPILEAKGVKRKLLNFTEKLTYNCATKIYPNSFGLYDMIVNNKLAKPTKLEVIANGSSNGIDTNYFNPKKITQETRDELRSEFKIKDNDIVFIFVGRLVKDKGLNELILAFTRLQSKYKTIKLLLVGVFEDDLDPLNQTTIETIKSNRHISYVGWQTEIRPYLSIADIFVFPSYREGFPNVVMQAGAMELPCIVTDINGCNEIIEDQKNGIIIPAKNVESLQMSMQELIENSEKRKQMASRARKKISDNYQREFVLKALLKEYKKLE